MKKSGLCFFSLVQLFISLGSAYAEDYYTNPQDLGQGTETVNNADAGTGAGNNNIADSMSQVTQNGMQELDSVVDKLDITDVDKNIKDNIQRLLPKSTALDSSKSLQALLSFGSSLQGMKMMLGMPVEIQLVVQTEWLCCLIWTIVFSWDAFFPYVAEVFLDDVPNLITKLTGTDSKTTLQSFVFYYF